MPYCLSNKKNKLKNFTIYYYLCPYFILQCIKKTNKIKILNYMLPITINFINLLYWHSCDQQEFSSRQVMVQQVRWFNRTVDGNPPEVPIARTLPAGEMDVLEQCCGHVLINECDRSPRSKNHNRQKVVW